MRLFRFLFLLCPILLAGQNLSLLPDLPGAERDKPASYAPENLYEYIDGASDLFLAYGFKELTLVHYKYPSNAEVTLELYDQGSPENAFGMYSQERPREGEYFPVGAEGYGEEKIFNCTKGPFYVKLSLMGCVDERPVLFLERIARRVAERLPATSSLTSLLNAFPQEDKRSRSETYVLENFLGHPFLSRFFSAEYSLEGKTYRLFLSEKGTPEEAALVLKEWNRIAPQVKDLSPARGETVRLEDPFNGTVLLKVLDKSVLGVLSPDPLLGEELLERFAQGLARR